MTFSHFDLISSKSVSAQSLTDSNSQLHSASQRFFIKHLFVLFITSNLLSRRANNAAHSTYECIYAEELCHQRALAAMTCHSGCLIRALTPALCSSVFPPAFKPELRQRFQACLWAFMQIWFQLSFPVAVHALFTPHLHWSVPSTVLVDQQKTVIIIKLWLKLLMALQWAEAKTVRKHSAKRHILNSINWLVSLEQDVARYSGKTIIEVRI